MVTLEALLQQNNTPEKERRATDPGGAGGKGAQGLTYVMASGGRLWSTALRLESQRAEGAAERTVRCGPGCTGCATLPASGAGQGSAAALDSELLPQEWQPWLNTSQGRAHGSGPTC